MGGDFGPSNTTLDRRSINSNQISQTLRLCKTLRIIKEFIYHTVLNLEAIPPRTSLPSIDGGTLEERQISKFQHYPNVSPQTGLERSVRTRKDNTKASGLCSNKK
jgi:hypothetical protein